MKSVVLCAALVCAAAAIQPPRFASSSIVPSHSSTPRFSLHLQYIPQPVVLTINNVTLKFCLQQAYSLTGHQVFGPGWIKSARYDVNATLPPDSRQEQVWPALQVLLDDRFKLSLAREIKVMPVYALTVTKSGARLKPARDRRMKPKDPVHSEVSSGSVDLDNVSIQQFCNVLSQRMDRLVIDETGIPGQFEITLDSQGGDQSGLSLFSAVQRQLGLKLEPRSAPVEILTVRSAKR